jgi:hypothetical protein
MFLTIRRSEWLPQWSFDFWIIPYLFGEGLDPGSFRAFMAIANRLLALEIATIGAAEKATRQQALVRELAAWGRSWRLASEDACEERVTI